MGLDSKGFVEQVSLKELNMLGKWGYLTYVSFHFSDATGKDYFYDGYKLSCEIYRKVGILTTELQLSSFSKGIVLKDVFKLLRKINKTHYTTQIGNNTGAIFDRGTDKYKHSLYYLLNKDNKNNTTLFYDEVDEGIERSIYSANIQISKSYYKTFKRYRSIKPTEACGLNSYIDKAGVRVHSDSTDKILSSLYNTRKALTVEDYKNIEYKEWGWIYETLDKSTVTADVLEDVTVNQTMDLLASNVRESYDYIVHDDGDTTYDFVEDLDGEELNVIKTPWGKVAIVFGSIDYLDYFSDTELNCVLNNYIMLEEILTDGYPNGIIEVTDKGVNICASRNVKLNGKELGELNVPFIYCRLVSSEYFGNFVKLTFDEFDLYIEASVIPHLYHNINIEDWCRDSRGISDLEYKISGNIYRGIS